MTRATMTRRFALLVLAACGAGLAAAPGHAASAESLATEVAGDLVAGRLAAVVARFTPEMAKALPQPTLAALWNGVVGQAGAVRELGTPRRLPTSAPGVVVMIVPMTLERARLDLKVSVADDRVAGLFISPSEAPVQPWKAPDYVDRATFADVEVSIGAAPTALGGTLSLPKTTEKVPAVVLIHGSGPLDRDETLGPNRPFRDIAEGLASRGVAVLRYDKRTKVHPEQFAGPITVREETMDDVIAAVALLTGRPEIDANRIVIIGHSLGGTLAPRIATSGRGIVGVVIMAGATRPLPTLMVEQSEYIAALHGPVGEAERKRIDELRRQAARALAAQQGETGPRILGAPPSYWADLNAYDPAAAAAKLSLPLLILQGGRDYQVTADDLGRFRVSLAGRPNAAIREFPNLNHLFIAGHGKSQPAEYQTEGHVDRAVIEAIADFIAMLPK